tara:strand:- start:19574 stop:20143 length:570 start_codon:yes stop_codon:yes gene_type:complete
MITWEYNDLEGAGISFAFTPRDVRKTTAQYSPSYVEIDNFLFTYLFKFTNDMTGDIVYAYPQTGYQSKTNFYPLTSDRGVIVHFLHTNNPNDFKLYGYNQRINLEAGYYSYHAYEVFARGGTLYMRHDLTYLPANENGDFAEGITPDPQANLMQGLVETGKLLITEKTGSEEIKYIKHTETTTNYIYNG